MQKIIFRFCQPYFSAFNLDNASAQINLQVSRPEHNKVRRPECVPASNTQSGQEFMCAKGFGDVIVSASIQRDDLVFFAVAHTEDDYRRLAPLTKTFEHCNAVHVGQTEI